MNSQFVASQSVEITVPQQPVPIQHYLRQPQRLVYAIADPSLIQQRSPQRFRLKMRPLSFLSLNFQPMVELKVWTDANGTVHLTSVGCEIPGLDYINQRFSLDLKGTLYPYQSNGVTTLKGRADLNVSVDVPLPLSLTPKPILETTGNGLLKSVLLRIKQKLMHQLVVDYCQWAKKDTQTSTHDQPQKLSPADNPTV
ncbi:MULTISPECIES: DUF1997 domain-containing protein [unclassified Coleofasciculus]|uniref:DUF1997 domain-containing protein n=1 Tax=unclassified Coleofasciculus TaxID=2692782 RepID=UPI00188047FD|nr:MULTISPECIES: DUF1997 domain-containing protein [unclassified Coleofasciculus]MBE9125719.1 DUF1997 domain-containing protein [Coleofasciculus sp. LEGE 07081]MBE9148329.1 DUF1997 domain-containing protein [Coleofasciculus sp. LEGE 07092]